MFVLQDILQKLAQPETPSLMLVLSVRLEHRSPLQETQHLVQRVLLATPLLIQAVTTPTYARFALRARTQLAAADHA